ncbi:DUF4838 domain-containing protein [Hydrogenophaga sp. RWCD_12]|uniref:DUF4838 domain-containing protein n=1 Tax=Hydrogenophaga sp. RWCD_12 TaxID=3391190 RepID=UPI00398534B6
MSLKTISAVYRVTALAITALTCHTAWAVPATLAAPAQSPLPIVVGADASAQTRANAQQLATLLGRMTGQRFDVTQGSGQEGIVLGTAASFAQLKTSVVFQPQSPLGREDYLIRSHAKGVWVIGATDLGAQNGMWDLLYRLGYRQYFPGAAWEVVPSSPRLTLDIDTVERPSYYSRRIWYSYGMSKESGEANAEWCRRNRCTPGMELNTGHAYGGLANALAPELEKHPEYLPLINGQRQKPRNLKFELGNPELRALIARHAVEQFRKRPTLDSISMDPSDGGDWSQSEESAKLGSVSDQVLTLANEVAAAVDKEFPGKRVGIYAYNYHSPPPNIRVHPNVVVSVATAFIKGDLTVDELMAGWSKQGATLGVREYYSVNPWDRDQPGAARGSNLAYLRHTIPHFHALGARYMSAESSDNWAPNGLGYWLAARMLWDIREAGRVEALVEDFLDKAFGPAKEPMRRFYEQLDGSQPKLVVDDQVGRMYRALDEARRLAADRPDVLKRLDELTLYARYCTLYYRYAGASGEARQQALEQLIRHAWRMRQTMMVHTWALYRDIPKRDSTIRYPDKGGLYDPAPANPWKSDAPFTAQELQGFLREGVEVHPLIQVDFQPVGYGGELRLASRYMGNLAGTAPPLDSSFSGRGVQNFLTWTEQPGQILDLGITGGLTPQLATRSQVTVELFKLGGTSATGESETLIASAPPTPPDGKEHSVRLTAREPGLYLVRVSDGGDRTQVRWPEGLPLTIASTLQAPMTDSYRQWAAYFYVPRGTRRIGLYGGEHGEVLDAEGHIHFWLNGRQTGFYAIEVPQGQDGKFWRVRYVRGAMRMLTVPPYFARSPAEMLLPSDLLEREGKAR